MRRRIAWLVASAVALSLVPAAAQAADVSAAYSARERAAERKQNTRIKSALKQINVLKTTVGAQGTALANLETTVAGIDTRLKTIEGAAPQIIQGLTDLKDGLTRLGDAYQAVEYGRAGIFASANATVAAGGSLTSADIPDDGNAVTTGEDAVVVVGSAGATTIDLRAAIRSNEADGDSTGETAGQAGGYLFVVNNNTGVRVPCTGAPNPPGIIGTTPGDSIVTPSGTVTNLPLKNIPGGVLRTDTSKPDTSSTSLLPGPCGFAGAAGDVLEVHYSVNFVDIPTSTTPGPKD